MTSEWLNISRIEDYLFNMLSKCKDLGTVIAGDCLTDTLNRNSERITLISCGKIHDWHGYGQGTVLIFLFCKSTAKGAKNVPVLFKMEETLRTVIEEATHEHYSINRGQTYTDYDSKYDMHCNIIELNITIK